MMGIELRNILKPLYRCKSINGCSRTSLVQCLKKFGFINQQPDTSLISDFQFYKRNNLKILGRHSKYNTSKDKGWIFSLLYIPHRQRKCLSY